MASRSALDRGAWRHAELERHSYSLPYTLTGQLMEILSALATLEFFLCGERVAARELWDSYGEVNSLRRRVKGSARLHHWPLRPG
jgi:hypothetical protein